MKVLKMEKKTEENNLYFDLVRNIIDNITGVIGLSTLGDYRASNSFLNVLTVF